jgi:tetratricopeptide (TPR) repeat protein
MKQAWIRQKSKTASTVEGMIKKHVIAIALMGISIFLAYANSLHGTWAMDDIVTGKPVALNDIKDFIGFRKVAYITFLLNQSIAPFSPANFRVVNIIIHIINAALVYVIAYKSIILWSEHLPQNRSPKQRNQCSVTDQNPAFYAALLSGAVFGLHPININAVAYIVQRMASLAAFFVLLALLCYIFATQANGQGKAALLYVATGVLVVAGIFSKENAVMAIPLIMLYDYIFLARVREGALRKRVLVICLIGVISIGLTFYFLRLHAALFDVITFFLHPDTPLTGKGWMAADVSWTPLQHVLTEFRVVSRYIFLIAFPFPQLLVFDWWGFPVSKSITEPITTLFSIILIASLLTFSVWKIKRYPMLCFGILWYLVAISLESFFALGSDLYFEHRNYLPVSGVFIGIAGQVMISLAGKMKEKTALTAISIFCIVLGLLTFSRNFVWDDSITLWGDTLKKVPSNLRAMMAMGNAQLKLSGMAEAEKYYQEVIRRASKDQKIYYLDDSVYSLGMLYLFNGKLQEVRDLIERYEYSIESYRSKILKGFYKALSNDVEGALQEYRTVLHETNRTDTVVVHTLMGDAYRRKGLRDEAITHYGKAVSLDPGFSAAYYGLGVVFMSKGDIEQAYKYFHQTLSIDPDNVLALSDMADLMLIRKSDPQEALNYTRRAVSKGPPFPHPYLTMGNVLIVLGREKEAEEFYKRAMERGAAGYMVPFSKARAYYIKGDMEQAKSQLAELRRFKGLPEKMKNLIREQP